MRILSILFFVFITGLSTGNAQTQQEMKNSAHQSYKDADTELNYVYAQIFKEYKADSTFLNALKASQRNWMVFRDSEVLMKYPEQGRLAYGSMHPMCESTLLMNLTRERINTLNTWLVGIEEGDGCSGSVKIAEANINFREYRTETMDLSETNFPEDFSYTTSHYFSNLESKDEFFIQIPKGNIQLTRSVIRIKNSKKDIIHLQTFNTVDLIYGYALKDIKSTTELVAHLQDRACNNIDNASIKQVGSKNDTFKSIAPEEFEDYNTYIVCKNKKLPLFQFSLNEENSTYFGYSESRKRAVVIGTCC